MDVLIMITEHLQTSATLKTSRLGTGDSLFDEPHILQAQVPAEGAPAWLAAR
jgi:hypothetical protein